MAELWLKEEVSQLETDKVTNKPSHILETDKVTNKKSLRTNSHSRT
jgi:hypothetical protein